jgi:hypothetical protein
MRIRVRPFFPLLLGLLLLAPDTGRAQGRGLARGHGWNDGFGVDRGRDQGLVVVRDGPGYIVLRDGARIIVLEDRDIRRFALRSGRGPRFCASGAGHPVYGLRWCLEKGYRIGGPGSWFLRGDDLFLQGRNRVIVVRGHGRDADPLFWGSVVGRLLALVD